VKRLADDCKEFIQQNGKVAFGLMIGFFVLMGWGIVSWVTDRDNRPQTEPYQGRKN